MWCSRFSALFRVFGFFVAFRDVLEVLAIQRPNQRQVRLEQDSIDPVPDRVGIERRKRDRRLSAEGAVLAIKSQCVPRPPITVGPFRDDSIIRTDCRSSQVRGTRLFFGEILKPLIRALLLQLVAKGTSQFFIAPSTNSTSDWPTFIAAR